MSNERVLFENAEERVTVEILGMEKEPQQRYTRIRTYRLGGGFDRSDVIEEVVLDYASTVHLADALAEIQYDPDFSWRDVNI